ncbi:ribonuclease P protein subunit p14 [Sceloporus undulatus]|uniref:ribonuclease P protein subunit p14 n=1 Tax=Sceloporus undulatus TaxID=8520 RepID=UPI001C4BEF56|nr:ribonuclease P protein subunit p14 [Sceloporus undulatus]XP_042310336.1 ribonuclease P protein subunit p14 [Sceloporus undulatus]XP_042310337.1 ribonuclease P protein subunit p14 [Sceloporus undulatus]
MIECGDENNGLKPTSYERIVLKNVSEYHYLKIHLEFQEADISLNAVEFKQLIISALKRLHGEVGAALPVDVLTYEEKNLSAILRVPNSGLVKLWSALTLLGSYQNRNCAFRVVQTSPFLLALAGNSRELVLD